MKRVAVLPTLLTLGNLLAGYAAIARALGAPAGSPCERLEQAAMLVFLAMVFDVLDGSVARLTRSASRFGAELDSLADLTSFGVAPAVMVLVFLKSWEPALRYSMVLIAAYVAFGALRLARYNVEAAPGYRRDEDERLPGWYFAGLPIPAAGGTVVSLVILLGYGLAGFGEQRWYLAILVQALPFVMLLLGLLMVSRVPYIHLTRYFLAAKRPFPYLVAIIVGVVLVCLHHEMLLFAAFAGYVVWGGTVELLWRLPRRSTEAADERAARR